MSVASPLTPLAIRVVVPVFNPGAELLEFRASLAAASAQPLELVIVNNGAKCELIDQLASDGVVIVSHQDGNVGYGRAANLGATGFEGEWLVIANPDIVWEPGSLDRLLDVAQADPTAGSCGPRIFDSHGIIYPSARALPSLSIGVGHAVFHRVWPTNPWSAKYRQAQAALTASHPVTVGWLSGACLLVRAAAWNSVGGFDERYFMFFEDVDLGDRLTKAGWHNVYVPAAQVTHLQGASWKDNPAPMIRAHHASAKLFLFDRWGAWWQAPIRAGLGLGLWVREKIEVALSRRNR